MKLVHPFYDIEGFCEFIFFQILLKQICKLKSAPGKVNSDAKHPSPHSIFPHFPSSVCRMDFVYLC